MRRGLCLFLTLFVLGLPAAASAGEPPNQNDPCSSGGRNSCGTTGEGRYETYRYGLRWFGDYRDAVRGVSGPTFCIDLRYWYPGKDYGYVERSAAGGIVNRDGEKVGAADLRRMSYAIWTFGRSQNAARQGAVMLYVHDLMGDGAAGEVAPGAIGQRALFDRIARESARLAGPYDVTATVPRDLTVGEETTLEVAVASASGAPMRSTRVRLAGAGAGGLPGTVTTGADGTAEVRFTPSSARDDLRITATAADLAAPVPTMFVPTRGKTARNGQRLVAPASKAYRATVQRDVEPVPVEVSTQATPATIGIGTDSADAVQVTGPGPDWRARAEVRLFGPFTAQDAITCQGTPIAVREHEVRAGATTTPPIRLDQIGYYAYQLVIARTADTDGVTTPCPEPTEIVKVVAQPRVVTQVSAPVIEPGGQVNDLVKVSGLAGQPATVGAALYGPFPAMDQMKCDGTPVWTGTLEVPGDGDYTTEDVTLDTPGYYTYREDLKESEFVQPFLTECGEAAETTIVRGAPQITTKVSDQTIAPGDPLSDTAVVTGLGKLSAPVRVELWGPYESKAEMTCQGEPFWTGEFTAAGDGEYVTEQVVVDRAGYYTYREEILETPQHAGVKTACGEEAETSLARAAPQVRTVVNADVVKPGGKLFDRIRVTGLGETAVDVEWRLYGPYPSRAAMDCAGGAFASGTVRAPGDGTVRTPDVTLRKAGFYTYVERIRDRPVVEGTETPCGEEAETALNRPLILTGRGDPQVRTVYAQAAQGDTRKAPTRVRLARLGVDAPVSPIGIDLDAGALGISKDIGKIGWWRDGAAPGDARGTTLLAGHVDSAKRGAGAFYPLKRARRGDTITLDMEGGGTKRYRVVKLAEHRKENLPPGVFSRRGKKRLVLVTCGGPFQPASGTYRDNIVVTAVER